MINLFLDMFILIKNIIFEKDFFTPIAHCAVHFFKVFFYQAERVLHSSRPSAHLCLLKKCHFLVILFKGGKSSQILALQLCKCKLSFSFLLFLHARFSKSDRKLPIEITQICPGFGDLPRVVSPLCFQLKIGPRQKRRKLRSRKREFQSACMSKGFLSGCQAISTQNTHFLGREQWAQLKQDHILCDKDMMEEERTCALPWGYENWTNLSIRTNLISDGHATSGTLKKIDNLNPNIA